MPNLIYSIMTSLDGYIAGPNDELGWAIIDEELHQFVNDQQQAIGLYLYGRRMYDLMAGFWPTGDSDPTAPAYIVEFARIWKAMPKVVFSKTLEQVAWNARLVREDAVGEVSRLKAQPGKDLEVGGADFAATLMQSGLIDRYQLFVHPVILGRGKPVFPLPLERLNLRLIETRTFGSGVVFLDYRTA
ncbi:MAG: dihydrofolate reductase family protein [Anaerolineae bacterium]|nr:dihydrofolate reductase family protein [Anaerolineae bacterium]